MLRRNNREESLVTKKSINITIRHHNPPYKTTDARQRVKDPKTINLNTKTLV